MGLIPVARATRGVVATARGNLTNSRTSFITKDTPIFPHIELTIARINQSKERERERERERGLPVISLGMTAVTVVPSSSVTDRVILYLPALKAL